MRNAARLVRQERLNGGSFIFGEFAAHARDLGAKVIGGCCGTTPAEIAAIRSAVEDERKPRTPLVFDAPELVVALGEEQKETGLSRALAAGEGPKQATTPARYAVRSGGWVASPDKDLAAVMTERFGHRDGYVGSRYGLGD